MKIFLGDLAHHTVRLMNNYAPINIGYMASFLKDKIHDDIEIRLFKDPEKLEKGIENGPPDILALSNYVWCEALSANMLKYYKDVKKDGIAVWGGPNFPMNELHKAKNYLLAKPYVNFYIPYEGETPLYLITKAVMEHGNDFENLTTNHGDVFEGSFFIAKSGTRAGELVGKNIGLQVKDINTIPSPWLGGWMDEFLQQGFHSLFETQRGCPYRCTFCHVGLSYYSKRRSFSLERLKQEIEHIVKVCEDPTKTSMQIADSNFGMWSQDLEFAKWLNKIYLKTGFPLRIITSTGKGQAKLVLETVMSHPKLSLTNSVQSLDETVLKGIRRVNFPLEQMQYCQQEVDEQGKLCVPEVILGLPFETRESHLETLRKLITDVGTKLMYQFTLMLLPGTELYTDRARKEHEFSVKFRLISTGFGTYANKRCFEIEEVSVGTKYMSFDDYIDMRVYFFLIHNILGNLIYQSMARYLIYLELDVINFLSQIIDKRKDSGNEFAKQVLDGYISDTKGELFDSREAIYDYYSDNANYEDLLNGEKGVNLTHTYRMRCLLDVKKWGSFVTRCFKEYVLENFKDSPDSNEILSVVNSICKHVEAQTECQHNYFNDHENIPTEHTPITAELRYDLPHLFSKIVRKRQGHHLKEEKSVYHYYVREHAKKYILSIPQKKQTASEWVRILLRMDPSYLFPLCKKIPTVPSSF